MEYAVTSPAVLEHLDRGYGACTMCAGLLLGESHVAEDKYYGNCGQELRPGGRFCPRCGQPPSAAQAPTPEATVQPSPPQQPRPPSRWTAGRILLFVFVAPILLAVALLVFMLAWRFLNGLLGF